MIRVLILLLLPLLTSCSIDMLTGPGSLKPGDDHHQAGEVAFSGEAPRHVMASQAFHDDRIVITWDAVTGADYYTIERAASQVEPVQSMADSLNWSRLSASTTGTSLVDDSSQLEAGWYYAYRVTAHDFEKGAGDSSSICQGSLLAAPSTVTASKGTDSSRISISWTQRPGVSSYEIRVSEDSDTVSLGQVIARVRQSTDGEPNAYLNSYTYTTSSDERGRTLYFAVTAVGGDGSSRSGLSPVSSGYTRVVGAPSAPSLVSITRGDSTEAVTLAWSPDDSASSSDEVSYIVMKSYPGSSESQIFPMYEGQELETDESGNYILSDSDVRENVQYTYSITASNSIGMSEASVQDGYLLSAPQSLSFTPTGEGYTLSAVMPVGADPLWTYRVRMTKEDGSVIGDEFSPDELSSFATTFTATSADDASYQDELRTLEVWTVNNGLSSASSASASIAGIPSTPRITASQNKYTGLAANSAGVCPVEINLAAGAGYAPASYLVIRMEDDGSGQRDFTVDALSALLNDSDGTEVGQVYNYSAAACDALGRRSAQTASVMGYGSITGDALIENFEDHILKPWEAPSKHPEYVSGGKSSIWSYIRQAGMGSLGSASETGSPLRDAPNEGRTGTISYNATPDGIGGSVSFTYTAYYSEATASFFDQDFYLGRDASYSMNVSLSGSGSVNAQSFETAGMYPATIDFSRLSVSNNAFTGRYLLVQHHQDAVDVSYEVRV